MQAVLDFEDRRQNTKANQALYDANKDHLNYQARLVLKSLANGNRLKTAGCQIYDADIHRWVVIGDLRARVKSLRDHGIAVQDILIEGRFKEFYL